MTSSRLISRRQFVAGTSALAAGVALFKGSALTPALAQQTVSVDELMQPGPLDEHALGSADAPVTIVEYASMTCGACATFHNRTYPELKKRYIDTGRVRYIMREFPFDPLAAGAFMLARCAGGSDRYHLMIETLFRQHNRWTVQKPIEPLFAIARQAGFTQETFDACLQDQKMLEGIEAVRDRAAKRFGVNSTPTFFINGRRFTGVMSIDEMAKVIDPLIKS